MAALSMQANNAKRGRNLEKMICRESWLKHAGILLDSTLWREILEQLQDWTVELRVLVPDKGELQPCWMRSNVHLGWDDAVGIDPSNLHSYEPRSEFAALCPLVISQTITSHQ